MSASRGRAWHEVWEGRDAERADWNGMEECFDSLEDYDSFMKQLSVLVMDRLDLGRDDVVLDLGCGTGRMAYEIAPHVSAVVGVDYSRLVLDVARQKRSASNIEYHCADLNVLDLTRFPATKAYSMGAFLYLDSPEVVYGLLSGLRRRGIATAVLDLPDASRIDHRERHYDTNSYTHLRIREAGLLARFPEGELERGRFPEYLNGDSRFNFYLPARPEERVMKA
jgi:SAM-dependent methyltransferase